MSAFDFRPTISAGTLSPPLGPSQTGDMSDLRRWIAESWPDLPSDAKIAVLPYEDFAVIVEATRGQPLLTVRRIMTIRMRRPAEEPSRRLSRSEWIDNVAIPAAVVIVFALWMWVAF